MLRICSVVLLVLVVGGVRADDKETKAKLARPISIDRPFTGVPLKDVIDYLGDRYELKFAYNDASFGKAKQKPSDITMRIPSMPGIKLDCFLTVALDPVALEHKVKPDGTIVISAGKTKTLVKSLPKADKTAAEKLKRPIKLPRDFDGVPLKDVLEYVSDRYEIAIVMDGRSFKDKSKERREDRKVKVIAAKVSTLESLLKSVCEQVDAEIKLCDNFFVVTETVKERP